MSDINWEDLVNEDDDPFGIKNSAPKTATQTANTRLVNSFEEINKFIDDNKVVFGKLKEDDYDFFLRAKYGEQVDLNKKFQSRVKTAIIVFLIASLASIIYLENLNFAIKIVIVLALTYIIYKDDYNKVKNYYKIHLHDINLKLPYYLKSLEILIQHYTVPVAITRSLDEAPEMFKPGLRELIAAIDSGDSTIEPYMAFARRYPVRDSMRMMRLLYRLSIGRQERKQEQLLACLISLGVV